MQINSNAAVKHFSGNKVDVFAIEVGNETIENGIMRPAVRLRL